MAFTVVQMKFLAIHITNQLYKYIISKSFDIFSMGHLQNILLEHDVYLIS